MAYTDEEKKEAEETKVMMDYLKHLTTLSTGSLLLIVTFIEKIFTHPEWKVLVAIAIASLLVSILSAVGAMTVHAATIHKSSPSTAVNVLGAFGLIGTWLGFIVGMCSLTAFALRNLS